MGVLIIFVVIAAPHGIVGSLIKGLERLGLRKAEDQ